MVNEADYPLTALVRAGSGLHSMFQGKVYRWREKPREGRGGRRGFKMLPGHFYGERVTERPSSPFANLTDLIFDPTPEQIAEELRKAKEWSA
jgi:hypothetical protein